MALDVVLAVSLMWVAQDGEMKSSPVRGVYPTMSACVVALNDQIDTLARRTGATPVPSGDLCLPRGKGIQGTKLAPTQPEIAAELAARPR